MIRIIRRRETERLRQQVAADAQMLTDGARKLVEAQQRITDAEDALRRQRERPETGDWVPRGELVQIAHRLERAELDRDCARQALQEAMVRRVPGRR